MATPNSNNETKKPKLRLPFNDEKVDMGVWAFDHRVGLCVTLIIYLLFAIAFVSAKIFVGAEQHTQGFYVDLQDVATLEEIRDELQEQVKEQDFDWESVSNRTSNELSLDQRVVDDRGTDASQLNDEASQTQERMEANRQAYLDALNKIEEERQESRKKGADEGQERRDIKRQGNVTVSYSFADPVRHAQELVVPAYQCQGGGEVVVVAQLDRKGTVIKAEVRSGGDNCMQDTALRAARNSTFNVAADAPEPHVGTISYIFIPQ
ncbi:MAG: energy transducer TonB [Rikenellaceae bacterium]